MELHELKRAFDQFSPTQEQREAMRRRLLTEERGRNPVKRWKKFTAVCLAAALLLMACAFAAVSGLDQRLLHYLGVNAEEEPLISPMAIPLNLTVEDNGCTLEVKQVLADRYAAMILCEFTAPEGTVLDGERYELSDVYEIVTPKGERISGGSIFWKTLEDDNPADNHITLLYHIQPMAGEPSLLGCTVDLTLTQLNLWGSDHQVPPVCAGDWSFSLTLPEKDPGRYVSIQQPLSLLGYQIQFSSVYVSPLSLMVELEEDQDMVRDVFWDLCSSWQGNVFLTTADGETISIADSSSMSSRKGEGSVWGKESGRFRFLPEQILDPSEIASVTFFGTVVSLDA